MTIIPAVNITRQMTPFFIYFLRSICRYISYLYFEIFKVQWVPPLHYILVCKMHIYMPKMTLSKIPFFYIKSANFWCITCFVPNLISILSRSHGVIETSHDIFKVLSRRYPRILTEVI